MIEKILKCNHCRHPIVGRKNCYSGSCFCSDCFTLYSSFKTCTSCNKKRRILDRIDPPICQKCRFEVAPCARCGKPEFEIGCVTEIGPICNSCSVYYRAPKQCPECNKSTRDVFQRTLEDGNTKNMCASCYNHTFPTCSRCKYKRKPHIYGFSKEPICKTCAIEGTRKCKTCNIDIPAGSGHSCVDCGYKKTLLNRTNKGKDQLSPFFADTFVEFSQWLNKRRGLIFATTKINHYLSFFIELDNLAVRLNRTPSYKEAANAFYKAKKRIGFVVSTFLNDSKVITLTPELKEECANLDTIERQLEKFKQGTFFNTVITEYHEVLNTKLKMGKTSIRSIRLALTPAVTLLEWCEHYELEIPTNELLYGFLWHSPGRRAGVTGFINFLNNHYDFKLALPPKESLVFKRPKESKKIIKQKFIRHLRNPKNDVAYQEETIRLSISYLHRIQVPEYVLCSSAVVNKGVNGCRFLNKNLFLPNSIFHPEI